MPYNRHIKAKAVDTMSISSDKIRVSIVIDKEDKTKLEEMAIADDRSLNYIISKAIKKFIKSNANQ